MDNNGISKQRRCDFCDKVPIVDQGDIVLGCENHLEKAKQETQWHTNLINKIGFTAWASSRKVSKRIEKYKNNGG